jgi:hypothetical protein
MAELKFSKENVIDCERVARILFAPSYICDGRVAPTAFRWYIMKGGKAEDYISVLRDSGHDMNEMSLRFRPRDEGDERYGYAWLKVRSVRNLSGVMKDTTVKLIPYPSQKLPNHAGIEVCIGGHKVDAHTPPTPEVMMVQKFLANLCSRPIKF